MKRLLLFLFSTVCLFSQAQDLKPCGTSMLARRHAADRSAAARARLGKASQQNTYFGERRGLIILVEFPDLRFQDEDALQTWSDIANLEGYTNNLAPGSVSDYFHDQSYGQFRLTFDVVGPVEAQHEYTYYGKNIDWGPPTGWFDQNVGELVEEACLAVSDQVRFADYDWDKDGEVEQVFLLYAGHGENDYWTKDSTVIWPHMASLSIDWKGYEEGIQLQGVRIDTYACSNEINHNGKLAGLGTFCHEFSHCLGLPDLYNTDKGVSVVGSYDIMDQGCYNGNNWCPLGYSSYERYACGWLTPVEVTDPNTIVGVDPDGVVTREALVRAVYPLIRYPDACLYRETPDANDYYLIENRLKESWDAYLSREGLMVWHIDYDEQAWEENTVNNDPEHLRVKRMSLSDIPSGIANITAPEKNTVAIYDLQGRRLSTETLPAGHLYIVKKSDGSVRKQMAIWR